MTSVKHKLVLAALIGVMLTGAPALAQRDPAYQTARAQGLIGEKPDGYLEALAGASAAVRALVDDLNIRRRQEYTRLASERGATVEQVAFTTGCNLIARTVAGEKYQAPDGSWQTRTSAAPTRDARCV
jgi:uncharacterized protein